MRKFYIEREGSCLTYYDIKINALAYFLQEFPGNTDAESPVINVLPMTVEVQYIKIIPTDWKNWISIRAEILGCYHPYGINNFF